MRTNRKKHQGQAVLAILVSLFACGAPGLAAAESYSFGIVPQYDQRQLFGIWMPLLDELQRRTGLSFKLVSVPTIPAFEKEFLRGSYDFAYMNPYHFLRARKSQGYVPLVRDRVPLRGILVVRKDSAVTKLSALNGKVVAFPSPNALGASLLMRADLSSLHHVSVVPLYVKTHDSVYLHVVKGLADAGGGVQQTLGNQEQPVRDSLRTVYTTRDMPSHPIVVHTRVPETDAARIKAAFLAMAATKKGRKLLSRIPMNEPIAASIDEYSLMLDWGLESYWVKE